MRGPSVSWHYMFDVLDSLRSTLAPRYDVEREIGAGGMARVYLAVEHHPHRRVAIKVLDPEVSTRLLRERFIREVDLSSKLSHPHIVPVFAAGEAAGLFYYVMPYLEGESLRHRLRRQRRLPLDEALRIARDVADALGYAHGQGIIHRDIKPENILLSGDHAIVADFGIARAISAAGSLTLTQAGQQIGSPGYMSPEQAMASGDLDARTDIYSLGCVLFEMSGPRPASREPSSTPFPGPSRRCPTTASPRGRSSRRPSGDRPIGRAYRRAPSSPAGGDGESRSVWESWSRCSAPAQRSACYAVADHGSTSAASSWP